MARRGYSYSPQCVHDGCTERAHYYFETRREERQTVDSLRRRGGWRCVRHTRPDEVLSTDATAREVVLTNHAETYGVFWRAEGSDSNGSGFTYGPGFKAYAEDFPIGTRLIVAARVEVPDRSENDEEQRG